MRQGEFLFQKYELELKKPEVSSFDLFAEEQASDLVLASHMVSEHIYRGGLVPRGKQSRFSPIYKANLSLQYAAIDDRKGNLVTTAKAHHRANVLREHALRNYPSVQRMLKRSGKSEYDFYYTLRAIALVESIQCDYISGVNLSMQAEKCAGVALIRRFVEQSPDFREYLLAIEVDYRDDTAIVEFLRQANSREVITKWWGQDKYFQRRDGILTPVNNSAIGSNEETSDNVQELRKANIPEFTEDMFVDAAFKLKLDIERIVRKVQEYKRRGMVS